jgi:hypothetical protein
MSAPRLLTAIVCISLILPHVAAAQTSQHSNPGFAIRLVDETMGPRAQECPMGDDRLPNSTIGIGQPGTQ